MKKYYVHDGQAQHGPFDLGELKAKNISPNTHIWFDNLKEWTSAGQIEELKILFASFPPVFKNITPPTFNQPIPSGYPNDLFTPEKNKKPLYIGLTVLGILLIIVVYLFTKSSENSYRQSSISDSIVFSGNDKTRLDSLDQIEKDRQAINKAVSKKNMEYRNNWWKYIEQEPNSNYSISSLGGISNLEINVTNNTNNILDEVMLTMYYYKPDGQIWQTNELPAYNIQPHSNNSVKVPNTTRGIRFETKISKITSKSLHFCYDSGFEGARGNVNEPPSGNSADPWFCK